MRTISLRYNPSRIFAWGTAATLPGLSHLNAQICIDSTQSQTSTTVAREIMNIAGMLPTFVSQACPILKWEIAVCS